MSDRPMVAVVMNSDSQPVRLTGASLDFLVAGQSSLFDLHTVFFSPDFLIEPSCGWMVVYGDPDDDATGWMVPGTLVKLNSPPRIWRLTGHTDFSTGYLEGTWPD